ncbi:MAG TPA: DUF6089 family protein [Bacteroidia bacterium]|jgi:hypothetical protein|nr:DUF6089 family protein [Bacteroidia bacterium]
MKKPTLLSKVVLASGFLFMFSSSSKAQYLWDAGVHIGASNYLGDMGGNELTRRDFVADMKMAETKMSAGGFARYKINRNFSGIADLNWVRIAGDDKLSSNPGRNGRNLNFRNDIAELTVQGQFNFFTVYDLGHTYRYRNSFRAFVGLGIGAAYHSPKAYYNGDYVALRPLETEGVHYTKVTGVIPASAGFYFTLNKHYRIGYTMNWRTTFSDYLDDVSTVYADPSKLSSPLAAELANRSDELNLPTAFAENFTPGNKRGDPTHKDSYLTSTVDMSYVIRGHSSLIRGGDWIYNTQRHPSKYTGPSHHPHALLIRKHRYHW